MIEILENYFSETEIYAFVVLFGSMNRGNAYENSDVDIAVYFDGDIDIMKAAFDQAWLENMLGRKVDIVVLNGIAEKDPLAVFEILDNHRLLMLKNTQKYIAFKTHAQLTYLDHAELIRSNREALGKRIGAGKTGERNYA